MHESGCYRWSGGHERKSVPPRLGLQRSGDVFVIVLLYAELRREGIEYDVLKE